MLTIQPISSPPTHGGGALAPCAPHLKANRNKASTMSDTDLAINYTVGVTAACGTAFGMSKLCDQAVAKYPKHAGVMRLAIPFSSVVLAGNIGLLLSRGAEISNGVEVQDKEGNTHGVSKAGFSSFFLFCTFDLFIQPFVRVLEVLVYFTICRQPNV